MNAAVEEQTKNHEVPPEFRVKHAICHFCYPNWEIGSIAKTLCGIEKAVEGVRRRSEMHKDPASCLVCVELFDAHHESHSK